MSEELQKRIGALASNLLKIKHERKLTYEDLSEVTGVSVSSLKDVMNGYRQDMKLSNYIKLRRYIISLPYNI